MENVFTGEQDDLRWGKLPSGLNPTTDADQGAESKKSVQVHQLFRAILKDSDFRSLTFGIAQGESLETPKKAQQLLLLSFLHEASETKIAAVLHKTLQCMAVGADGSSKARCFALTAAECIACPLGDRHSYGQQPLHKFAQRLKLLLAGCALNPDERRAVVINIITAMVEDDPKAPQSFETFEKKIAGAARAFQASGLVTTPEEAEFVKQYSTSGGGARAFLLLNRVRLEILMSSLKRLEILKRKTPDEDNGEGEGGAASKRAKS
eukprot:FR738109.1.p1 GENE.FR738109.1~~FR738109.1.p1  ORF type:complete len:275 (+),score=33.36 FR738109.1:32-826(+)